MKFGQFARVDRSGRGVFSGLGILIERKSMSNENVIEESSEGYKSPELIKHERTLKRTRQGVFAILVLVAVNTIAALILGSVIKTPDYSTGSSEVSTAMSMNKINDAGSTTVYQQMVSNGWVARDLLQAVGHQNATLIEQNTDQIRLMGLLLFNILFTLGAICIAVIRIGLLRIHQNEYFNSNK